MEMLKKTADKSMWNSLETLFRFEWRWTLRLVRKPREIFGTGNMTSGEECAGGNKSIKIRGIERRWK
jgi:hypothetical protein